MVELLDEYCNDYECNNCYFSRYNNCPMSMTANRIQEEIFREKQDNEIRKKKLSAKLQELLNEYCPGDCNGCPMDEMDVIKHGNYEYKCPLEAVIDIIKCDTHGKTD